MSNTYSFTQQQTIMEMEEKILEAVRGGDTEKIEKLISSYLSYVYAANEVVSPNKPRSHFTLFDFRF